MLRVAVFLCVAERAWAGQDLETRAAYRCPCTMTSYASLARSSLGRFCPTVANCRLGSVNPIGHGGAPRRRVDRSSPLIRRRRICPRPFRFPLALRFLPESCLLPLVSWSACDGRSRAAGGSGPPAAL